jgi:tetratricopeptide (TPR) repeat protein
MTRSGLLSVAFAVLAAVAPATAQSPTSPREAQANTLFQNQDWAGAATAYQALAEEKPRDAQVHLRLGIALHGLSRYAEAASALETAERLGAPAAPAAVRLAKTYGRLGRIDAALTALQRAADRGFAGLPALEGDEDLAAVRRDGRYAAVRQALDRNLRPCAYAAEYRALDFWVGEWDVRPNGAPDTTPASRSRIELIEDQCVVYEQYTTPAGYSGRSFNSYEPERKRWEQFWVDNKGAIHHYVGNPREGNMYYQAEGVRAGGPGTPPGKVRMTFFNQGADQVRQLGEQSTDEGKTWTVSYDLIYKRRASGAGAGR